MEKLYEYVKALTTLEMDFPMYTCDDSAISIVEGEQYQRAKSTYTLKKASPFGTYAGGVFFGAQGVWIYS